MRPALVALSAVALAAVLSACGGGGGADSTQAPAPRIVPLEISGGGSAQFRVEGDNSIANYGSEAGAAELGAAARLVHAYFAALAGEEWAGACSYLSREVAANVERLAAAAPTFEGGGCAGALGELFGKISAAEAREATTLDAASLRREGERAFLLYRGFQGKPYFVSLLRDGGGWAVAGLSPTGLG